MIRSPRLSAVLPFVVACLVGPLLGQAAAQGVFNATPSTLGVIPDSVGECVGNDGPPLFVSVPVSGLVGGITAVSASMTISHTWMGEVSAVLISPDGTNHVLFGRTLANAPPGWGTEADLSGTYSFSDAAGGNWWTAAQAAGSGVVPPGVYRTSELGNGTGSSTGALTTMNPVFNNREANGTWLVRFTDSCRLDIGTVSAFSLTIATNGLITPPIAAVNDAYTAGRNTPLVVPAPGVLANDQNSAGSGALQATLQSGTANGTVTLALDGSFTYTPNTNFLGTDSFTYVASNNGGNAPAPATVNLTVVPIQPPTNFRVDRVVGNTVTVRWDPPAVGPRATSYVMDGGIAPGSTLASLGSAGPVLTFTAPTGSFFIRVKALDGAMVSAVSNEVPLHVNTTVTPSAPSSLTGLVNTDALALSWKLTYGGGEPTSVVVDVTGTQNISLPLGTAETFAFNGVPGGTYTFAVRAVNAGGSSAASAPVTLTFPGACSGVPAAPSGYAFYNVGSNVFVLWDPPTTGPAATSYALTVTGAFVGSVPVGASRSLATSVGPGTYTVSVSASNACGTSAPTATQTVTIP